MLYVLQLALLAVATAIAFWRGGWPERSIATIMIAWVVIDRVFHLIFPGAETYRVVDLWHFGIDLCGLAAFLFVALKADRIWTLWVCSLQLISVLGHILRLIDEAMFEIVYAIFLRFPFWIAIALLLWASVRRAWSAPRERAAGRSP